MALVGLALDVVTKVLAVRLLDPADPVPLWGGLLTLRLIRNPGAAFSQGERFTYVFAVAAILVLGFVVVRLAPRLNHLGWAVALGLLSAGVSGNLVDRLLRSPGVLRGHVVDFLQLPHWPIFNVADMCISGAAVMIMVLAVVKNVGIDGTRPGRGHGGGRTGRNRPNRGSRRMAEHKVVLVPDGLGGERVDTAVARLLGLSRGRTAELIGAGRVLVDGRPTVKSDRLLAGAMLEVELDDRPSVAAVVPAEVQGVRIVHDDDDIVVIDKPVGVAAHPSLGWSGPDVLGHLAGAGFRISTSGVPERRGIVQRLDVGTSGLMVVAKSELAYTMLKRAFRSRSVDKTYHALVQGHPDPFAGTIDAPIGRHPGYDYKMAVIAGGRESVTHYDTIDAFVGATLLQVRLESGRTHQIRVHMAAIRHPCVGDPMYGADPVLAASLGLERQWLHAVGLGFSHPRTGDAVTFRSDYPEDLRHALETVRAR